MAHSTAAFPLDVRKVARILRLGGWTYCRIASEVGASASTVKRWLETTRRMVVRLRKQRRWRKRHPEQHAAQQRRNKQRRKLAG